MDTYALQRELGGAILQATEDISVDVKQPDYNVRVEVRMDGVYSQIYEGAGGLPVGTGGKTLLMLSGGIDSPVAGMEIMKRGVYIEAIHFHSPPLLVKKLKTK